MTFDRTHELSKEFYFGEKFCFKKKLRGFKVGLPRVGYFPSENLVTSHNWHNRIFECATDNFFAEAFCQRQRNRRQTAESENNKYLTIRVWTSPFQNLDLGRTPLPQKPCPPSQHIHLWICCKMNFY